MKRALIISLAAILTGCSGGGGGVFSPLSPGASGSAGVSVATAPPTAIPTPSPSPTPVATAIPTPVPTPGALSVTPTSITLGGGNPTVSTFSATESNYAGTFTETDTCTSHLTNAPSYVIATVVPTARGGWTVTQGSPRPAVPGISIDTIPAKCFVKISDDHGGSVTVNITSNLLGLVIQAKGRK